MSTATEARLGGERINRIRDRIVERYWEMVDLLVNAYMADGYAPLHDPITPYEQYQKLIAMRGAGDPAFWGDPRAQAALAYFEQRFGPVQPLAGPGYQPGGIASPPGRELAVTQTAQNLGVAV